MSPDVLANPSACLQCREQLSIVEADLFDTRFGIAQLHQVGKCTQCGLEQISPIPAAGELAELYRKYYNFGGEKGTSYTRLRELFLSSKPYRLWLAVDGDISFHRRSGSGRLLDVGCNEGRGLQFYAAHGFETEGLEPNPRAAAAARETGFVVHAATLEQLQPARPYDTVVLSNVLEHALDPGTALANVHRILKPGGEVWISCPNSQSLFRRFFGRYWINWHVPFHIVHLSPDTLTRWLQAAGFEVIEVRQETPALWIAHSIIARLRAQRGQPNRQLRNPFLVMSLVGLVRGLFFPLLWFANRQGRGDCLVVVARKKCDSCAF